MLDLHKSGEQVREFFLDNIQHHSTDIVPLTCKTFDITRQAVNKHIKRLAKQKAILIIGNSRKKRYLLHPIAEWDGIFQLDGSVSLVVLNQLDRPLPMKSFVYSQTAILIWNLFR